MWLCNTVKMLAKLCVLVACGGLVGATEPSVSCRYRSNHLRQDGGLCFEIPPWQHQPVVLEHHLLALRNRLGNDTFRRQMSRTNLDFDNSELTRYMDTVLAPFLDTYHRNIHNSYQQLTGKILGRIKDEINAAVLKKQKIYTELSELADELQVPPMCTEERRSARTVASKHVALIYACTEEARTSIGKMGKYAEEMISITKKHMQFTLEDVARTFRIGKGLRSLQNSEVSNCITELSRAAVGLGYELDLSLTNARRHNEQSCEKLVNCGNKARKQTDEIVAEMRESLYQCVYA